MKIGYLATSLGCLIAIQSANADSGGNFKRFSVSAGWMHVMPQGNSNPFNINTSVLNGYNSKVGTISPEAFLKALDPDATIMVAQKPRNAVEVFSELLNNPITGKPGGLIKDPDGNLKEDVAGYAIINGLDSWQAQNTGLEADDVDTLGLTFNYHINDNVSLQLIGGIPPKVDIKGKGAITAPLSGIAKPGGLPGQLYPELDLLYNIPITDLDSYSKAATARAWTPVLEIQYQFGTSGVNKFRPYLGAGLMYAYFNDVKLNKGIESDLVSAGHMIQNIYDEKAGAALDGKESSGEMRVKVKANDAIAPVVTAGFTYDITPSWFATASVSYAKLNNKATIDVVNKTTNEKLIHASTKIDIDPVITFVGLGYRF